MDWTGCISWHNWKDAVLTITGEQTSLGFIGSRAVGISQLLLVSHL